MTTSTRQSQHPQSSLIVQGILTRRIAERFEWRYTPKHGSWLNIAEWELSVLSRQCLARRIPDKTTLAAEVEAWKTTRNDVGSRCNWQFTTQDARTKLSLLNNKFHDAEN